MSSSEDPKGTETPQGESPPTSAEQQEDSYSYNEDPYSYEYDGYGDYQPSEPGTTSTPAEAAPVPAAPATSGGEVPPPATTDTSEDAEDDDEGMLRMSFMEHLEELRRRLMYILAGVGIAFAVSLVFANDMWRAVSAPAVEALNRLGFDPQLAQITPMDAFMTIWVKLPMLAAIFIASPWILYQVWAFIAPGLYRRERRWAAPFVLCSAGLFIAGGCFAYFVAFRFGLTFLLGIGKDINVKPVINLTDYFDLFVNVMLGVGLVFEMPVLIFFLTLLRITSPAFLLRNARYAILVIVVIAALITPTPDVFNLMLFSVPMAVLFFVGIFAGYLLDLKRENKRFPWLQVLGALAVVGLIAAGIVWLMVARYGFQLVPYWPFITR
jgi:sec-independent protein translocase protein TatC